MNNSRKVFLAVLLANWTIPVFVWVYLPNIKRKTRGTYDYECVFLIHLYICLSNLDYLCYFFASDWSQDDAVTSKDGKNQTDNSSETCTTSTFKSVRELSLGGEMLNNSSSVDMVFSCYKIYLGFKRSILRSEMQSTHLIFRVKLWEDWFHVNLMLLQLHLLSPLIKQEILAKKAFVQKSTYLATSFR